MSSPTVALLGTGAMGAGMARCIAGAGIDLRVWNRTRERAAPLGDVATVSDTPAEAVDGADVLLTMLYDEQSVLDVVGELRGAIAPDTVWLQQSTIGLTGTERAAALADELGMTFLDAPVLGTKQPAETGDLVVLASGPDAARDRVEPVLEAIAARTLWVGEAGAGTRLKLAANHWVLMVIEGLAETLALTRDLGLDPALVLEAVRGGAMDAPYVQLKGKAMLDGAFEPAFALSGALKDAGLIQDAARDAGTEAALLALVHDHLSRADAAGHGGLDMAATYLTH